MSHKAARVLQHSETRRAMCKRGCPSATTAGDEQRARAELAARWASMLLPASAHPVTLVLLRPLPGVPSLQFPCGRPLPVPTPHLHAADTCIAALPRRPRFLRPGRGEPASSAAALQQACSRHVACVLQPVAPPACLAPGPRSFCCRGCGWHGSGPRLYRRCRCPAAGGQLGQRPAGPDGHPRQHRQHGHRRDQRPGSGRQQLAWGALLGLRRLG
jgi:hypothetical protein